LFIYAAYNLTPGRSSLTVQNSSLGTAEQKTNNKEQAVVLGYLPDIRDKIRRENYHIH
jgi:hypothetical protein